MQNLILIGIVVIFIGILLVVIGSLAGTKTETKFVVGVFPFFVGNEPKLVWLAFGICAIILLIFFLLPLLKGLL